MTHLETHINRVEKWSDDRGLYDTDSPLVQFGKMVEEEGELIMAIGKDDRDEIRDAIGDIRVCLISVCKIAGVPFLSRNDVAEDWYGKIGFLMMLTNNISTNIERGETIADYSVNLMSVSLCSIAAKYNLTLEECDDAAWNEIKNRTGKTVDGEFKKDTP